MVNDTSAASSMASTMTTNATAAMNLPPLPAYTLTPTPQLLPYISDFWLSLVLPVLAYWVLSIFFHIIDVYDVWPQYRLHTPEEITQRNHATRYEVARDVIIQQIIQMLTGALLSISDPPEVIGKEEYDVAVWATRIRLAQRALPSVLALLGLNAATISKNMSASHPLIAGALAGGYYPFLNTKIDGSDGAMVPTFANWELATAKAIYYLGVPALQLFVAIIMLDTWQYFLHRLMHVNRWMYSKCSLSESLTCNLRGMPASSLRVKADI
jgi:sphinganine C4-monooxygenase